MAESLDLKKLSEDLKAAGTPWQMDPQTSLAQMTEEERRIRLGFVPPAGAPTLEEAVQRDVTAPRVTQEMIQAESGLGAPAAYDLRNVGGKNFTTPVKDQGGCGSCVAFGVAAVMETTLRRQRNDETLAIDLSEAHLFYCHGGEDGRTCQNGWFPDAALDKARDKGVTMESVYPYSGSQQACAVPSGWQNNIAKVTGRTELSTRSAMKDWISTRGSITGCFIVYQDFFSYRSGVYRHVSGNAAGGHCVEIVGYSDSQRCWICKNSWGTNWGEGGFFRIGYGECQIETWYGPWGANAVTLRTWQGNLKVNGLWSNRSARNAYAHFQGVGWRRVVDTSDVQHHAMLTELVGAKAGNRGVRALVDGNEIQEIYVV
ncbi:C1 family peptidase [Rhodosalinus sp.]|uniref:C1 family peptidase n=1 Tax=Rhodosalinus sp. TaxID=2047741 RepID=UPI00397C09E0